MSGSGPSTDRTPHVLPDCEHVLDWKEVFGNSQPVELEIGPGKGLFLANSASKNPARNYVGVELAAKYARKAADRVAKLGLSNVRVVQGDGRQFLARCVPPGSLDAIHVYFPDPWWKKRHKKRRVFTSELVADTQRALRSGGVLYLATDVEEYFGVMKEIVAAYPAFTPLPLPEIRPPEHDLDYLTNFERKYRIEGRPIYRDSFRYEPRAN